MKRVDIIKTPAGYRFEVVFDHTTNVIDSGGEYATLAETEAAIRQRGITGGFFVVMKNLGQVDTGYEPVTTLTNPTQILSDASRFDLIFTEPTTVHFEAPGRTDLVLSIVGYEHITWEGVIIHGAPASTGVVWASALYRSIDSSWHLLCEQDASQGSGGGANIRRITWADNKEFRPVVDAGGNPSADAFGRIIHAESPHLYNPNGWMDLVTLSVDNGADEVIADTSYQRPGSSQGTDSVTFGSVYRTVYQQMSLPIDPAVPTGFTFAILDYMLTASGVRIFGALTTTTNPNAGRPNPLTSNYFWAIPKTVLPPVGFYDTGESSNQSHGLGMINIPGGSRFKIRINSTSKAPHGINFGFDGLSANPITPPDPLDPSLTPIEKAYADLGSHYIPFDRTIPYVYWSMYTDQT